MRPAGLSPLSTPPVIRSLTITNYNFVLIRNPGRSNGGLYARFAPLFNLLGRTRSAAMWSRKPCNLNDGCYTLRAGKVRRHMGIRFLLRFPDRP